MIFKTLLVVGCLNGYATARLSTNDNPESNADELHTLQHLDLEVVVDGKRELFPLLPGTKCPSGYTCRARHVDNQLIGTKNHMSPMVSALRNNLKTPLAMTLNWQDLDKELTTVVDGSHRCSRRNAMAKAAGLIAGVGALSAPVDAAETKEVKMGSDSGLLAFVPATVTICKGDSVKWINNKAGPHNVVFDEDAIPSGVNQEAISMDEQLGEEGDTFVMKFDTAGNYEYYCEPHRGAGMAGKLVVV